MKYNKIFEINMELIINNILYKKEIIDEKMFSSVNAILLKKLEVLKRRDTL